IVGFNQIGPRAKERFPSCRAPLYFSLSIFEKQAECAAEHNHQKKIPEALENFEAEVTFFDSELRQQPKAECRDDDQDWQSERTARDDPKSRFVFQFLVLSSPSLTAALLKPLQSPA